MHVHLYQKARIAPDTGDRHEIFNETISKAVQQSLVDWMAACNKEPKVMTLKSTNPEPSQTLRNTPYSQLKIGDKATYQRTLTERDLVLFATVSGDYNPVHLDAIYAASTPFGERIAHGMWTGSLISAALAIVMPGPGGIYSGQELKFLRPVKLGDALTVELEVLEKNDRRKKAILRTDVTNQHGKIVVKGTAEVMPATDDVCVERAHLPNVSIEGM